MAGLDSKSEESFVKCEISRLNAGDMKADKFSSHPAVYSTGYRKDAGVYARVQPSLALRTESLRSHNYRHQPVSMLAYNL